MKLQSKELALNNNKKNTQKENVERHSSHIKNAISIISTHSSPSDIHEQKKCDFLFHVLRKFIYSDYMTKKKWFKYRLSGIAY